MTEIRVIHRFFPVGQGLFAAGSVEFWPPPRKRHGMIDGGDDAKPAPLGPYRWTYDCGSSTVKQLVTSAIGALKSECEGEKIDLLTLSHFHKDHISGVVDLLKEIGAKTVMLPWAPLWHRLLIGFDQGLRAGDPEMLFFVDPVQYLVQEAGDGFEQVLFVMPSDDEGPSFPTEPPVVPEPREDLDAPDKPSAPGELASCSDLEVASSHPDRRVMMLRPGQAISVLGIWEFVPYNDPDTRPSDPKGFEAKVASFRTKLLNGDDKKRKDALKCLRSLYEATFNRSAMNDVSLILYGGAIGTWRGYRYCDCRFVRLLGFCDCWQEPDTKASILLTGDSNLSKVSKWDALVRYFDRRRAVRTSVFQAPHHGARANWYSGLAAAASPGLSVFSSDPNHNYGHPHAEVLRDFWSRGAVQVDQHSDFSMQMFLKR